MRRPGSGQALVETAVTMPVLVALFFGFVAAGVAAQGYVDLNTAVYLAAASNVTAPADLAMDGSGQAGMMANQYAYDTFDRTVAHDSLLVGKGRSCSGDYTAGGQITCQGSAVLQFSRTPLSIVIPFDPTISAQASAVRSPYRSVLP
ncbi:MAG TPA: TadE family protein [Candidatus Dormibacteraeota bacterium]|jgi:Flp pilus assembly protein TadG